MFSGRKSGSGFLNLILPGVFENWLLPDRRNCVIVFSLTADYLSAQVSEKQLSAVCLRRFQEEVCLAVRQEIILSFMVI